MRLFKQLFCYSTGHLLQAIAVNQTTRAKTSILSLLSLMLFFVSALCQAEVDNNDGIKATLLKLREHENNIGSYPVSILVTKDYMRIDDTSEQKDFILFSRKDKLIYSVSSENQQIIKIRYQPVNSQPPLKLEVNTIKLTDDKKKPPAIANKQPEHYQTYVNGALCYDWFAVAGLLPDVVQAMKAFKQVIAGQQAEVLQNIPGDMHDSCDLVENTFYPTLFLEKGFPVVEQGSNGYSRMLLSYSSINVSAELFKLPQSYRIIDIN